MELFERFSRAVAQLPGDVIENAPLKEHCTFKIGGPAEVLYIPRSEEALIAAIRFCNETGTRLTVLGNGSNVLISDRGLDGIVVKLMGGLDELRYLGDGVIAAGAGVSLKKVCLLAKEQALTGLEFAYGIPGSVGGAVYMNAGAYGSEIKNVLLSVRSVSLADGGVEETPAGELEFQYRNTSFMKNGRIVTKAYFRLSPGDPAAITDRMNELMAKRKASQPLEYPSAGSTFKRPPVGYAAAHIDQCGLKGYRVGGAEVSRKHAGFVLNADHATFNDVRTLMRDVQRIVLEKDGVLLEPEVEILE